MKRVSDRLSRFASPQEQQADFWQLRQAVLGPRRADTVQEVEWQRHGDRCLPRLHRGLLDMKDRRRRHHHVSTPGAFEPFPRIALLYSMLRIGGHEHGVEKNRWRSIPMGGNVMQDPSWGDVDAAVTRNINLSRAAARLRGYEPEC